MLTIAGGILLAVVIFCAGGWLLTTELHNPRHNKPRESPEECEFRKSQTDLFNIRGR